MRIAPPQRTFRRQRRPIRPNRTPRLSEREIHILFGVMRENRADCAFVLNQKIQKHIHRIRRRRFAFALQRNTRSIVMPLYLLSALISIRDQSLPTAV